MSTPSAAAQANSQGEAAGKGLAKPAIDTATGRGKLVVPKPFVSLRLIFYWDTFLALWLAASPYAVWYLVQMSSPVIYGQEPDGYGFRDVYVGLCYLTGGAGVITGGGWGVRLREDDGHELQACGAQGGLLD